MLYYDKQDNLYQHVGITLVDKEKTNNTTFRFVKLRTYKKNKYKGRSKAIYLLSV